MTVAWWSEFLRQVRRRLDLSQRELAARAGVPKSTVADLEAGRVEPGLRTLERLLEVAGLRLEVLDRTDQPAEFHSDTSQPRDAAGRRLPAHLDARLRQPWADPDRPSALWPGPRWTFHLDRARRDDVRLAGRFGVWGCGPPVPGGVDSDYVRGVCGDDAVETVLALAEVDLVAAGAEPTPSHQRRHRLAGWLRGLPPPW